jgi:hypothetical protein
MLISHSYISRIPLWIQLSFVNESLNSILLVVSSRGEVCCNGKYPVTYYFLKEKYCSKMHKYSFCKDILNFLKMHHSPLKPSIISSYVTQDFRLGKYSICTNKIKVFKVKFRASKLHESSVYKYYTLHIGRLVQCCATVHPFCHVPPTLFQLPLSLQQHGSVKVTSPPAVPASHSEHTKYQLLHQRLALHLQDVYFLWGTRLRHYATRRKVAGSISNEVTGFFNLPNPSSHTMALESIQSLRETSISNLPWGKRRSAHKGDNLTAICGPIV